MTHPKQYKIARQEVLLRSHVQIYPVQPTMARSLISLWKQDTARNTFVYTQFLISLPFTVFFTYTVYQLQLVGFLIGTDAEGGPCTTYCIVPFGNGRLDLNSVLLYMNAMTFGFGGFIMIFLTAYADFWSKSISV